MRKNTHTFGKAQKSVVQSSLRREQPSTSGTTKRLNTTPQKRLPLYSIIRTLPLILARVVSQKQYDEKSDVNRLKKKWGSWKNNEQDGSSKNSE